MQQNPPFWYSKTYIVATLTLLLMIGLSEAGTVLGVPKLQRDQHALEAGSTAFQTERIRQNLRVTHSSSSNLGVAVAAATQDSNPAKVDARSSSPRRRLAGEPRSTVGATEVPIGVLAHFSSWLDKAQSLPALAATARVTPAAVATTSSSNARQGIALDTSAADESAGYQPVKVQAQTWFQQLLRDLDGDLKSQDEQLSKLHKRGRAKQPEEADKPPKHGPAWGEDENERLIQDRDHDREPSMQHNAQQGTHHGDQHHDVSDDQLQHQRDRHRHDYHDVHRGEGPPHSEDVYPDQKQLDEPNPPWKDDHPEQRQAAGRHDGMHLGPDKQPDQAPEEQHTSRPPVHMPGTKASDRSKYVPDDTPRYAPRNRPGYAARRWVPSRAPSSSWFVPPMAQQYRPSVGNHAANGWAQGPGDGYSSWPVTACFQEVTRSDCRTTGSGAVGSPVQLLGYRSTLGCCQDPVPQGGPELTSYPGLTSFVHSMRRPASSAVMPMHLPAAAQKPSVGNSSGHPQESAAAAAATVASNHTTAAATAVPSQDAWSGLYGEYGPNIPGADNAASCVWNITQMEMQPAESSFFAQKIANATGICQFANAWQPECSGPLCDGLTVTIQADMFDTYAVSRYPGTKADLDTSCEDYVHSSSIALTAKPRKRAAKAGHNTNQVPAQQQNQQQQAAKPDKPPPVPSAASSPAPSATETAPAAQRSASQQLTNTTTGTTKQSTAGAELSRAATTDAAAFNTKARKLLESYSPVPRYDLDEDQDDDGDDDDGDDDDDDDDNEGTDLDAVLAGARRRHGRSGYFGGRAIIITGYIASIAGAPQAHVFKGGSVEHVSRFSQALPLSKAEYGMLPTVVPEVVPGSYKYVLYKRF